MPEKQRNDAKIRAGFWRAFVTHIYGESNRAFGMFDSLAGVVDSGADPYTYNRIRDMQCFLSDWQSKEAFVYMLGQLEYYRKVDDPMQMANLALMISNNLTYDYASSYTFKYLHLADSLYGLLGREDLRKGVRFNEATLQCKIGDTVVGGPALRAFFRDSSIINDALEFEMLCRNYYYSFGDSASLFRGYDIVRNYANPETDEAYAMGCLRSLYEALLVEFYLQRDMPDSARHYMSLSTRHRDELSDNLHFTNTMQRIYARYYGVTGDTKNELRELNGYISTKRTIDSLESPATKLYFDNVETLHRAEMDAKIKHQKQKMQLLVIIGLLIIAILSIIIAAQRKVRRQKLKELKMQLDAARKGRRLMTLALENEESQKVLTSVKEEASRISRTGNVSAGDIKSIEKNVRLHLAGQQEMDAFAKTFAEVNPNFGTRLRELAPEISDYNIRLCSYIVMGMNNNEIANIMHVKPGSMRQARMRLRQKFGLTKDESLTDFLRNLAE